MPHLPDDSNVDSALLRGVIWVAGTLWALLMLLVGALWKRQGDDIAELKGSIATKANTDEVERRRGTQIELFKQQREDKADILAAIAKLDTSVNTNHQYVLQQLGERPTRKEMMEFFQAGLAAANPRVPDPRRLAP